MKASLNLLCLALVVVAVFGETPCNSDDSGMPICTGTSTTRYRNNWDPTHFWVCNGTTAVNTPCNKIGGFDEKAADCIPWDQWKYVPVCPDTA